MGALSKQKPQVDWNDVLGGKVVYSKGKECVLVSAAGNTRMTPTEVETQMHEPGCAMYQPWVWLQRKHII